MTNEFTSFDTGNSINKEHIIINPRRLILPVEEIIARYIAGESENAIATAFGVSRGCIRKRLTESNINIRRQTDANRLMMSKRTPEENARNCEAAHKAAQGRKCSFEERCKCALSREANPSNIGAGELIVQSKLFNAGIDTIPQRAIGPYNCDLAAAPVAVEIWGGNFHWFGRKFAREPKRMYYLLNSGWHIFVINVWGVNKKFFDASTDQLIAFIQKARSNPSGRCEYRMIWGTGELLAFGSSDDNQLTIKETLSRAKDSLGYNYLSRR